MKNMKVVELINQIISKDNRYTLEAYLFVQEALTYTVNLLEKPRDSKGRHVSGQELLDGIRDFTLNEFGPLSKRVLNEFGIFECIDFGHIVFNLVDSGLLGKTDEDSIEDFSDGYDFDEAFRLPFLPRDRQIEILG